MDSSGEELLQAGREIVRGAGREKGPAGRPTMMRVRRLDEKEGELVVGGRKERQDTTSIRP